MYCSELEGQELQGGLGATETCGTVCLHTVSSEDINAKAEQLLMRYSSWCYPGADLTEPTDLL